jgi:hypothetical protein
MKDRGSRGKADFPVVHFHSVAGMLGQSLSVYFHNFGFIAQVTLAAYAPLKLAVFLFCDQIGVAPGGTAASLIRDAADMVLGALVAPAVISGMIERLRSRAAPSIGECLRRGRKLWGRTLWNDIKADITIVLRLALLIVPGVIAMVRLCLVEEIVALEGDAQANVLGRSREITEGNWWKIFFVCLPAAVLSFVGEWLLFSLMGRLGLSWPTAAALDCVMAVASQWGTILLLMMYLALVGAEYQSGRGPV